MGVMHVFEWARIQGGKLFKTNSSNSTTKIRWNPESHLLIRVLSVYIYIYISLTFILISWSPYVSHSL